MIAYYLFGIILLGTLGIGGFGAALYGFTITEDVNLQTVFFMAMIVSLIFVGGFVYSIVLYRREKAKEAKLLKEKGEATIKEKRKEEYSQLKKAAIIFVIGFSILLPIIAAINESNSSKSDGESGYCTICAKKATNTFQGSSYCKNHYDKAVKWAVDNLEDD